MFPNLRYASLAAVLAVYIYRGGRMTWNHVLNAPGLPNAYYAGGNWTSHCSLITDPSIDDAINFCEHITFWDHRDDRGVLTNRLVVIGCDPNRKAWNTVMGPLRDPNPRGRLFLYDPTTNAVHSLTLTGYPAQHDFHPLGMDAYPSRSGSASNLFVVNHARAQTTIEQFVLDPAKSNEARHVRTLRSPWFASPNAIALTGPSSFFVSNDHLMTRRLPGVFGRVLPLVETLAGLPLGWVAHVSVRGPEEDDARTTHSLVALGIPFANGLALSPSRTHLAVASTTLGRVYLYALGGHAKDEGEDEDRGGGGGAPTLSYSHSIPVPFFPDNLAYDDDGALLVAGLPHYPALVRVAANVTGATSPSWAVSLTPRSRLGMDVDDDRRAPAPASMFAPAVRTHAAETLFQSDGSVFGCSSTVLRDARTGAIYVAGLYERGILTCRPQQGVLARQV